MLKKIILALAALALTFVMGNNHTAVADTSGETTPVILHKRLFPALQNTGTYVENDGNQLATDAELLTQTVGVNGIEFTAYDASAVITEATAYYNANKGELNTTLAAYLQTVVDNFSNANADDATAIVAEWKMAPVETVTTTTVNGEDGVARFTTTKNRDASGQTQAYFIVETDVSGASVAINEETTGSMLMLMNVKDASGQPLREIHLYPKNDAYARDVYFFKYGVVDDVESRLMGAQFVFTKLGDASETLYLAADQSSNLTLNWVTSTDPLTDSAVRKFTSDDNGLVSLVGLPVSGGEYAFYEVAAPTGYELDETPISVTVPSRYNTFGEDAGLTFNPVLVNGKELPESAGAISQEIINAAPVRFYNYPAGELPNTDGEIPPTTTTKDPEQGSTGILPATGGMTNMWLTIIGGLLLLSVIGYAWYNHRKGKVDRM